MDLCIGSRVGCYEDRANHMSKAAGAMALQVEEETAAMAEETDELVRDFSVFALRDVLKQCNRKDEVESLAIWSLSAQGSHIGLSEGTNVLTEGAYSLAVGVVGKSGILNVAVGLVDACLGQVDSDYLALAASTHSRNEETSTAPNVKDAGIIDVG